jgi:hypothetical protein
MVPLNDPTAPPALELVAETVAEAELLVINPALYKDPANPPMLKDPETVALELTWFLQRLPLLRLRRLQVTTRFHSQSHLKPWNWPSHNQ